MPVHSVAFEPISGEFAATRARGRIIIEDMMTSEAVTRNVRVRVRTRFDASRSNPPDNLWFFEYTVQIANEGPETVQLVSRHWIITDALNQVHEVKGLGVVGKQPVLAPGEEFEYTSGCPLTTPFGSMRGTYQMLSDSQERFDIEVAPFILTEPYDTVH
jgi:ApaG protein